MRQERRSAWWCRLVRLWWLRAVWRWNFRHGWRCAQRGSLRLWCSAELHVCLCRLGMRQERRCARRCRLVRLWWQRTVRRLGLRHGWRCGQRGSLRLWRRVELRVCPCRLVMRQERRCAQFRRASFRVLSGRLSLPQNQDTAHHVCFSETGVICGVKIPPVSPARIELQHGRRRWRCCRLSSLSGFRSSSPRRRR